MNNKLRLVLCAVVINITTSTLYAQEVTYTYHHHALHFPYNATTIFCRLGDTSQPIACCAYSKIAPRWYALHTLYVHPNYRNQSIATALLAHTCQLLKHKGATAIFLQPGAFEVGNTQLSETTRHTRLPLLLNLYAKAGFKPASWLMIRCALALYQALGIPEDAHFLMVKEL